MKTTLLLLALLFSAQSFAAVQPNFTLIGVVILTVRVPVGTDPDQDATILWDRMLVPPEDSLVGPGKAIKTSAKEMSLVCNKKSAGDICVITINPHGKQNPQWVEVDASRQWARFHVEGAEADFFSEKFKGPFESVDKKLRIFSMPGQFEIQYSGRGF